uniref:RING-type E3 ubiquitin transferase n=1 Tax=Anthurium amnicola TaxID=1678845 RepID=A0A1D1YB09_9ARAE
MDKDDPGSYRYMNRRDSQASAESSGAFSDCNSDRSGEFPLDSQLAHRLLVSSAADSYYSDELVRVLIADLESDSVETQLRAAMELRLLAKHSTENRVKIARAGAIRPLVSLVNSTDPQLQEHGVTAVLNLSLCDENKDLIAGAGAIKPLVRALKSGTPAAKENAACALLRLGQVENHKIAIGRSGAIPPLVGLLETGSFRGKKDASTALYMLCSAKENKLRAVRAGVMKPLLELMADTESGMVDKAAYVLNTLVGVPEAKTAVAAEDGIPVLVEMLEVGSQRQKEVAASILLQICEESVAYRGMVAREGAIPPLVALSQARATKSKDKAEALITLLRQPRSENS